MGIQVDPVTEAHKALLDLFAELTGLPAGLYHRQMSNESGGTFCESQLLSQHCALLHTIGGKKLCEEDHLHRADGALQENQTALSLCHAGLWNQSLPVTIGKEDRSVLLYGQIRVASAEHERQSKAAHDATKERLRLSATQAIQFDQAFERARVVQVAELDKVLQIVKQSSATLRRLFDAEDLMRLSVERVTHEVSTRLQNLLAKSENLSNGGVQHPREKLQAEIDQVLRSVLALSTVIQTLGSYLQKYKFKSESLEPLIEGAKIIYQDEAAQRDIEIRVNLWNKDPGNPARAVALPIIEMSRAHLEHAINNVVHNAVKYSFRGRAEYNRARSVDISGHPSGDGYRLSVSNYGVGILPEEIEAGLLFLNNYQGKLTSEEYRTGSGKGLYFVKDVVDRHHGNIKVESKPLGGESVRVGQPHLNTFHLWLPFKQPKEKSPE